MDKMQPVRGTENEFDIIQEALGNQYCKKWECRKIGLKEYNGYCKEHKQF